MSLWKISKLATTKFKILITYRSIKSKVIKTLLQSQVRDKDCTNQNCQAQTDRALTDEKRSSRARSSCEHISPCRRKFAWTKNSGQTGHPIILSQSKLKSCSAVKAAPKNPDADPSRNQGETARCFSHCRPTSWAALSQTTTKPSIHQSCFPKVNVELISKVQCFRPKCNRKGWKEWEE